MCFRFCEEWIRRKGGFLTSSSKHLCFIAKPAGDGGVVSHLATNKIGVGSGQRGQWGCLFWVTLSLQHPERNFPSGCLYTVKQRSTRQMSGLSEAGVDIGLFSISQNSRIRCCVKLSLVTDVIFRKSQLVNGYWWKYVFFIPSLPSDPLTTCANFDVRCMAFTNVQPQLCSQREVIRCWKHHSCCSSWFFLLIIVGLVFMGSWWNCARCKGKFLPTPVHPVRGVNNACLCLYVRLPRWYIFGRMQTLSGVFCPAIHHFVDLRELG